jgi:hypothetical protein
VGETSVGSLISDGSTFKIKVCAFCVAPVGEEKIAPGMTILFLNIAN